MKTNDKQLAAARRAMEVIAAREGISVEEVRREISLAILMELNVANVRLNLACQIEAW